MQISIRGSTWKPTIVDPEYPQEVLLKKSLKEIIILLRDIKDLNDKHKIYCIFKSLKSDMNKFLAWIESLSNEEKDLFKDLIIELSIRIPYKARELLNLHADDIPKI